MTEMELGISQTLLGRVRKANRTGRRRLVALTGAPASGKTIIAAELVEKLTASGCPAQVVPMDGFHLHNQILMEHGLLQRKGSPETFDVRGLISLVSRLHDEPEVIFPTFDRARDIAIAGAGMIEDNCDTVIVEGNYLLYDAPLWRDLHKHWDFSIRIDVPEPILKERLIDRWLVHGLTREQAEKRAADNDLANAALIAARPLSVDVMINPAAA